MLEMRDLRKSFGALRVTDGLSLRIEEDELRAIIGPNGAGKTSLISQIAGELRSDSGEVRFGGVDVSALSMPARRKVGISRTYQISSLFRSLSALDNVRLAVQSLDGHSYRFFADARSDHRMSESVMNLLERVGLADRANSLVSNLAHGEQRQLEIAMALAGSPRLLLLDEPTAGMGSEDASRVTTLIGGLKGTMSIILVEHDMPTVFAVADRITVLVNGREITTDTPDEVRRNEQVRASYLGDDDA